MLTRVIKFSLMICRIVFGAAFFPHEFVVLLCVLLLLTVLPRLRAIIVGVWAWISCLPALCLGKVFVGIPVSPRLSRGNETGQE